jgi:hypothetical protein
MKPQLPEGSKVYLTHYRFGVGEGSYPPLPSKVLRERKIGFEPRGGATSVRVLLPDGTEAAGFAACSQKDNFSKVIGRNIAIGRALKSLET